MAIVDCEHQVTANEGDLKPGTSEPVVIRDSVFILRDSFYEGVSYVWVGALGIRYSFTEEERAQNLLGQYAGTDGTCKRCTFKEPNTDGTGDPNGAVVLCGVKKPKDCVIYKAPNPNSSLSNEATL